MPDCVGTSFTDFIYTKLSTFPSRKIPGVFIGMRFLIKLCSNAEKTVGYRLFGDLL